MIYDCFTFFNEIDLLKLRLETLDEVVDYFVLVEATKTFSNKPKRLFYKENKHLFEKFSKKIIHIIVDDMPESPRDAWELERFQRNAIGRGLANCKSNDYIIISDLDEIPNPEKVGEFNGEIGVFDMKTFYYKINCQIITEEWRKAVILKFAILETPQKQRDLAIEGGVPIVIDDGGWHFSYVGSPENIAEKIKSFSHQEYNKEEYTNLDKIAEKIKKHHDLFERSEMILRFVEVDNSFPKFIINNKKNWSQFIHELTEKDHILNGASADIICLNRKLKELNKQRNGEILARDQKISLMGDEILNLNQKIRNGDENMLEVERSFKLASDQLVRITSELDQARARLDLKSSELAEIYRSKAWRVISLYRRIIQSCKSVFIFPAYTLFKKVWRVYRRDGFIALLRRIKARASYHRNKGIKPVPYNLNLIESMNINRIPDLIFPVVNKPEVSIIIPVYNKWKYTYNCLDSLLKNIEGVSYEVVIVDDGSTDDTIKMVKRISNLVYVKNKKNLGFVGSCNHGASKARGEYVVFLNNDTAVKKDWLVALLDTFKNNKNIGLVGSKLIYPDGRLQEAGGIIWKNKNAWNYGRCCDPSLSEFNYLKDVDYCSGASIAIKKEVFDKLKGFDPIYSPGYCEDSDLAFRVRELGLRTVYQPLSEVYHFEGITSGTDLKDGMKKYQLVNSEKFFARWQNVLDKENCDYGLDGVFWARDRSKNKKTILIIDHYAPTFDKDAGSRTVYQYIKLMSELGYNVKFIGDNFHYDKKYVTALEQLGVEVLYGQYYFENWAKWVKDNSRYIDVVFLNRPHVSVKYIDVLREHTNAKIIFYGHDLHYLRMEREYELTKDVNLLKDSEMWKGIELGLMRKADISLYPSAIEVGIIGKIDSQIKADVLTAYMYDDKSFDYNANTTKNLLFIGGFNHKPNVDAAIWLCREIFPKILEKFPDIRLYIVGSNPTKEIVDLKSNNVIVKGFVEDAELNRLYREVRLVVAPLRYGAGIKGKIIESMYNCTPVITTDCGAEGISNKEGIMMIANSCDEFVDKIVSSYNDINLLNSQSRRAKLFVNQNYSIQSATNNIKKYFN